MSCEQERRQGRAHGPHRRGRQHHGPHGLYARGHQHGGGCGCGCGRGGSHPFHFQRRFQAKEEKIAGLEKYLESLRLEAKAVEERLTELKAG
jgi:hypothetical protein